jgi:hypothetical protein
VSEPVTERATLRSKVVQKTPLDAIDDEALREAER